MDASTTIDARGFNCPLPVLKAKKALRGLVTGDILEVFATDPGSAADMKAFCRTTGNELLQSSEDDGVYTFYIKKIS